MCLRDMVLGKPERVVKIHRTPPIPFNPDIVGSRTAISQENK